MTSPAQPAQQPAPAASRPHHAAARWHTRDLMGYAARWGVSAAAIRAALKQTDKDSFASPDDAEKLVRDFLSQDLPTVERERREARMGGKRGRGGRR